MLIIRFWIARPPYDHSTAILHCIVLHVVFLWKAFLHFQRQRPKRKKIQLIGHYIVHSIVFTLIAAKTFKTEPNRRSAAGPASNSKVITSGSISEGCHLRGSSLGTMYLGLGMIGWYIYPIDRPRMGTDITSTQPWFLAVCLLNIVLNVLLLEPTNALSSALSMPSSGNPVLVDDRERMTEGWVWDFVAVLARQSKLRCKVSCSGRHNLATSFSTWKNGLPLKI